MVCDHKCQGHGFIGYPKGRNVETALGTSCPCVLCIPINIITLNIEQGREKQVKVGGGGLWLSGALFHKKRPPSSKFIYGGYTTQLSLKLLNSECL